MQDDGTTDYEHNSMDVRSEAAETKTSGNKSGDMLFSATDHEVDS